MLGLPCSVGAPA